MKNLLYLFAFLFLFTVVACDDEEVDNTKPTINLVEPANGDTLHIGEGIHFDCEFTDDVELGSYKIDIHSNFDGHTHDKSASEEEHPWSYENSWSFDAGKKNADIHHHEIVIPDSIQHDGVWEHIAHGEYHFAVYCTDASGNESKVIIDVILGEGEHHHDDE